MMKVTIEMPEEYMGDIMGDVTARRGRRWYGTSW